MKAKRFKMITIGIFFIIIGFCASAIGAEMEWSIEKKIDLKSPALDMALSVDGQQAFLLSEDGNLNIYKMDGALEGTIPVGKGFDRILPGPTPDTIFLSNRGKKTVELLTVDLIYPIDIKGSPFKGPEDAPVVITLFTDFQCPYCAQMGPILDDILKAFPKEAKLVYKSFPLRNHQYAMDAAKAAMAAHQMGKFWEYHDLIFKNFSSLSPEKFKEFRTELKLDEKEFEKHLNDPKIEEKIKSDFQNGIDAGVRGTPSLYINGKQVKNRRPEAIKEMIKLELEKSKSKK